MPKPQRNASSTLYVMATSVERELANRKAEEFGMSMRALVHAAIAEYRGPLILEDRIAALEDRMAALEDKRKPISDPSPL